MTKLFADRRAVFCFNGRMDLSWLPPELIIFLTGASPISELRGAIPLAVGFYGLPIVKAFVLSVLGNLLPPIILLPLLGPVSNFLIAHFLWARWFFDWLFARTRKKFSPRYETLGELALFIFVAIPFPLTGAWTGSVAAFLFGIPKRKAFVLVFAGILVAGLIVSAATVGFISWF